MEQTEPQETKSGAEGYTQTFIAALHALEHADGEASGEVDAITALYATDARLVNSASILAGEERTGTEAAREFWADYKKTMGKAHSEFHHSTVSENAAGLFWITTATSPSGEADAVSYDGATLLEFDDSGKITFFQGYYDTAHLNREMGLEKG